MITKLIFLCFGCFALGVAISVGMYEIISRERKSEIKVPDLPAPPEPEHRRGDTEILRCHTLEGTEIFVPMMYVEHTTEHGGIYLYLERFNPEKWPAAGQSLYMDDSGEDFIAFNTNEEAQNYLNYIRSKVSVEADWDDVVTIRHGIVLPPPIG